MCFTSAQVGIDAHVTSGSAERFALAVRYMLLGFGVAVLLCHTKVDDVDQIGVIRVGFADKEVVRLDITVNEVLFMNCLYPR